MWQKDLKFVGFFRLEWCQQKKCSCSRICNWKKSEIIIACVAGKKVLKFRLDIHQVKKYNQMKDKLIERILPPYITQIQQSCANHIVREGIMPTPEAIFGSINL